MQAQREHRARRRRVVRATVLAAVAGLLLLAGAAFVWRGAIWRSMLDPKTPYPAYRPPPAPDYARGSSWALWPADASNPGAGDPPADVFFLGPALSLGGRQWNTPIDDRDAAVLMQRVVLPNYAGPFQTAGRVFAPRYRAAVQFAYMTLRDDARDARVFAYGDARAAFAAMLKATPADRPLVIAGVGEGAELAVRLLQDKVLADPALSRRVAAVYLMNAVTAATAVPASGALSPCRTRSQGACVLAWSRVEDGLTTQGRQRLERALTWAPDGRLVNLGGRPALCVNPLTGSVDQPSATRKANLGAADATGLEWGARPAVLSHQVSTACRDGLLWTSRPQAPSLEREDFGFAPRRVAPYNLFYADIEADVQGRLESFLGRRLFGAAAPPLSSGQSVGGAPVHRID